MEEITKRISQLIQERGLTNAAFADAINIKRPIISHILSGRNKPSLHVVLQILETYPDVQPSWLLLGKENSMQGSPKVDISAELPFSDEVAENRVNDNSPTVESNTQNSDLPSTLLMIEGNEFRIIQRKN